ncbi:MAG TPA: helix-turn-helix domain-containing protein, partial [Trueperaceae bacterium]|nr:helix-turn-helix domain-containing protein [Trueperaceae bacterium]
DPLFEPPPAAILYFQNPQRRGVPAGLQQRCQEQAIGLVVASPAAAPSRVEEAALRALVASAAAGFGAIASAQHYLTSALTGPKPERDLLDRVNRLSGVSLALITPWGEVTARAGTKVGRFGQLDPASLPDGRMRLAGKEALVSRVTAHGRLRSVLLAFDAQEHDLPLIELATTLLLASALQRSAAAQHDRERKGALLAEWLAGPQAAALLAPRLQGAGLEPDQRYLVAACEVGLAHRSGRAAAARSRSLLERLREAGDEYFLALGYGVLSETRAEHCLWAFGGGAPESQADGLLRALLAVVNEDDKAVIRLGLSLPRTDLSGVADAYHQAMLALQSVATGGGLAWFDEFDPVYWVLKQQPPGNLATLRDRLVGDVKGADEHGKLWRTLNAYLQSPNDLGALAAELHIHVNTLRYRLRRIEELVGAPLDRPETLAKLYVAQQIDAMLERAGGEVR